MKKIFLFVCILYCSINVFSQTSYYNDTKTFFENGYAYQCDVLEGAKFVTLYNKENKFTYVNQISTSSGELLSLAEAQEKKLEDDTWTRSKRLSIVNNAFSEVEKQRLRGKYITITLYINSITGKVDEVNYQFVSFGPYATIPISTYRQIELELKKNIWYTTTNYGKRVNYIMLFWLHEIK